MCDFCAQVFPQTHSEFYIGSDILFEMPVTFGTIILRSSENSHWFDGRGGLSQLSLNWTVQKSQIFASCPILTASKPFALAFLAKGRDQNFRPSQGIVEQRAGQRQRP